MRHYANRRGVNAIEDEGRIRAGVQSWNGIGVFCERASRNPLSAADAEKRYGLRTGRGRDLVEFDTVEGEAAALSNPITSVREWFIGGDVPDLPDRAASFRRRT